jgi:FkbM family methyltransferase
LKLKLSFFLWLVRESILLDVATFRRSKDLNFIDFIFKKYFILLKHFFVQYKDGDSVAIFGEEIYYDTKYGVAGFQRILTTHKYFLNHYKIENVKTVVDVGASVGYFSLMCKYKYPNCNIYAFEPIPETFLLLRRNLEDRKGVFLFNSAVGDFSGSVMMSVNKNNRAESKTDIFGKLKVNQVTLNKVLGQKVASNEIEEIDILKIDVETFENTVLNGASKLLSKTHYLFLEVTLLDNSNYTISSLMHLLYSKDYNFQLLAFRNFDRSSDGPVNTFEMFFKNLDFHQKR